MRRERRYIVIEFEDAWSGYVVTARNKAEAIAKVRAGEHSHDEESWSGSGGPTGRYKVTLDRPAALAATEGADR